MANQNQPLKVQAEKKSQHKAEVPSVEFGEELAGPEQLPGGPVLAFGGGSSEEQAARLGDIRVQSAQRRTLARQIGRTQGNLHLQRVVSQLAEDAEEPLPSHSSSLSRESTGVPQAVPPQGRDEQEAYPVVTNPYTFVQRGLFGSMGSSLGSMLGSTLGGLGGPLAPSPLMDPDPFSRGGLGGLGGVLGGLGGGGLGGLGGILGGGGGLGGIPIPMPTVGRMGGLGGILGGGGGLGGLGGILGGIGGGGGGGLGGMLGGLGGGGLGGLGGMLGGLGGGGLGGLGGILGGGGGLGGMLGGMGGILGGGGGGPGGTMGLQQQMQKQQQVFQMLSNIMKSQHDTAMGAIRNMR